MEIGDEVKDFKIGEEVSGDVVSARPIDRFVILVGFWYGCWC